jgi:hypothetical protein
MENAPSPTSHSGRSPFSVAPPVNSLNVAGMIVPPRSSHSTGINVVRNDVAVVRKLSLAECANAVLGGDLSVHQSSHLGIRPDLSVSARMLRILNAPDSHLTRPFILGNGFRMWAVDGQPNACLVATRI